MYFSSVAESLAASKNPLYLLRDELSHDGSTVIDLVRGNVNEHGIVFPPDVLNTILHDAADAARIYRPDSFGQTPAREAVSRYYSGRIPSNQIVMTPGTSVSSGMLQASEPGDEILTPQPSYPLRLHREVVWRPAETLSTAGGSRLSHRSESSGGQITTKLAPLF
jgi:aspartate/methionine/tyrosine aminotransferase